MFSEKFKRPEVLGVSSTGFPRRSIRSSTARCNSVDTKKASEDALILIGATG